MNAKQIMCNAIDDDPGCLVDYADENEIRTLHAHIYALWREPVESEQYQNAQDFLGKYLGNAIECYYRKNREQAAEEAREYHDQIAEAA